MALKKEVYTARPKRTKPQEESPKASAKEKKPTVKDASPKPTAKKPTEKKAEAKKAAGDKKASAKRTAAIRNTEKKKVRTGRIVDAPEKKESGSLWSKREKRAESRLSAREKREREKRDAVYRDRRQAVCRGADHRTTLIVLLTVLFEAMGLLLGAVRTPGVMDMQALTVLAVMASLAVLTALALPRVLPIDPLIMALTNFLCGVGVVVLYTVSPDRGVKQMSYYALGVAAMVVVSVLVSRMRRIKGLTIASMVLGIIGLCLPLAFGQWAGGAKNWVQLPLIGSFQPSELVKLSLVLSMAYYFSAHRTVLQMMPAILFAGACLLLLMLQRDLGTALIYYLTTVVLFYAACGNVPLTLIGLGGGAGAAVLGYRMFAHVKVRVAMWRNPWSDPLDKGYQIIQALLAIGSGGLFGVGLGNGTPDKIPAYFNDFIFAVICEQLGLIFGMLVIVVYLLLIVRGVSVISRSRRSLHMLMGCGVLAMLAIQTFMIVGGVIKMIPLTGVTMPFLSYGGSSLLSCLMMIGILHGISARAQQDLEDDILGILE